MKLLKDAGGIVLAIMSTFLAIIGLSGNLSSIKKSKYATLAYGITLLRVIKVKKQLKSNISSFFLTVFLKRRHILREIGGNILVFVLWFVVFDTVTGTICSRILPDHI